MKWIRLSWTVVQGSTHRDFLRLITVDGTTWTAPDARTADYELEFREDPDADALDAAGMVSSSAVDRVDIALTPALTRSFEIGKTYLGVLFWTPSGSEREALAVITVTGTVPETTGV